MPSLQCQCTVRLRPVVRLVLAARVPVPEVEARAVQEQEQVQVQVQVQEQEQEQEQRLVRQAARRWQAALQPGQLPRVPSLERALSAG